MILAENVRGKSRQALQVLSSNAKEYKGHRVRGAFCKGTPARLRAPSWAACDQVDVRNAAWQLFLKLRTTEAME